MPMHVRMRAAGGIGLCLAALLSLAQAQSTAPPSQVPAPTPTPTQRPPPPAAFALDLRELVEQLPVTVKSTVGSDVSGTITLTSYRPAGDGPFPLVVMNHGRAIAEKRAQQGRQRFEPLARYLVSKGFAVIVPTRLGYGDSYGQSDPEAGGACNSLRVEGMSMTTSDQTLAAVAHARTLPWVDASRWVAIGQSVGGLAAVALAWRQPEGLVAVINFAGGSGGNPDLRPGNPCSPQAIEALWRSKAAASAQSPVSMLWIYWANDLFWGPEWPQRWARAWKEGGGALEFHQLPAVGADGHSGMSIDMDRWVPLVEAQLARVGFTQPGWVPKPPATGVAVADVAQVPVAANGRNLYLNRFLAAKSPRAFAVGPGGASGWATGDWAMGRALGFCQSARGIVCKLYAVDDEVVWQP
jgi:dienelactone hydrolase